MGSSFQVRGHEFRSDSFFLIQTGSERKETRKSSSEGVALVRRHLLKAYTRKQKIIARSSAEAVLYAAALGASEAKGVQRITSVTWVLLLSQH